MKIESRTKSVSCSPRLNSQALLEFASCTFITVLQRRTHCLRISYEDRGNSDPGNETTTLKAKKTETRSHHESFAFTRSLEFVQVCPSLVLHLCPLAFGSTGSAGSWAAARSSRSPHSRAEPARVQDPPEHVQNISLQCGAPEADCCVTRSISGVTLTRNHRGNEEMVLDQPASHLVRVGLVELNAYRIQSDQQPSIESTALKLERKNCKQFEA